MIAANELRVGNFVRKGKDWFVADHITILCSVNYEAIPLTPELLLSCGFIEDDDIRCSNTDSDNGGGMSYRNGINIRVKNDKFNLFIHNDDDSWYSFAWTEIKHLHQLQNLYYFLTGKELMIEFKK